ncbi:hypothetical protein V6N11_081023 [Hibiscus sabdariffa]|uniref:Uncharacterized protein n=1 Tax=Hibiscus sabdariffa TaxID=183260 RepID=A0ABR2QJ05_9ROSI
MRSFEPDVDEIGFESISHKGDDPGHCWPETSFLAPRPLTTTEFLEEMPHIAGLALRASRRLFYRERESKGAVRKIGPLRKAELFGSLPLCGRPSYQSASFLLMEYNNARASALLAFFIGAHRMYHSFSSSGGLLIFFVDRAALPHSTRPAVFTNLYNRCHKDSQLYYQRNKETSDDLALDIRRCGKSCCEKRKNHQKTTIVREGFHRKTPWFWQTDHNYRKAEVTSLSSEIELLETCGAPIEQLSEDEADSKMDISSQSLGECRVGLLRSN